MVQNILIDIHKDNTISITEIKKDKCFNLWENAIKCINEGLIDKKCNKLFLKWNDCNKNLKT